MALLEFAVGTVVTLGMSWDVFRHSIPPIELHGTRGSLRLPDPDTFGGTLAISRGGAAWEDLPTDTLLHGGRNWPFAAPDRANYRMLGVADLVSALAAGRLPRASGALALHVLDVMEAILDAAATGQARFVDGTVAQPDPLSESEAADLSAYRLRSTRPRRGSRPTAARRRAATGLIPAPGTRRRAW